MPLYNASLLCIATGCTFSWGFLTVQCDAIRLPADNSGMSCLFLKKLHLEAPHPSHQALD